jgi:hypothetical protein
VSTISENKVFDEINPAQVRYVKLGEAGRWEKECLEKSIIRFGFGTARDDRFSLCRDGKWDELTKSFIAEGKKEGTATRFTNEVKHFFQDDGRTLWITFVGERLCWGLLTPSAPERHSDGQGVWRKVADRWKWTDITGEELTKDRLSGALTKLAAYRGTSCRVDVAHYVIRRINGQKLPLVERAVERVKDVTRSAQDLMRLLRWYDFETLVDLIFSSSGWRRLGIVGKTQKTLDLDLILPSTGERAFVQVKSKTTSAQLAEY